MIVADTCLVFHLFVVRKVKRFPLKIISKVLVQIFENIEKYIWWKR